MDVITNVKLSERPKLATCVSSKEDVYMFHVNCSMFVFEISCSILYIQYSDPKCLFRILRIIEFFLSMTMISFHSSSHISYREAKEKSR